MCAGVTYPLFTTCSRGSNSRLARSSWMTAVISTSCTIECVVAR